MARLGIEWAPHCAPCLLYARHPHRAHRVPCSLRCNVCYIRMRLVKSKHPTTRSSTARHHCDCTCRRCCDGSMEKSEIVCTGSPPAYTVCMQGPSTVLTQSRVILGGGGGADFSSSERLVVAAAVTVMVRAGMFAGYGERSQVSRGANSGSGKPVRPVIILREWKQVSLAIGLTLHRYAAC